MNKLLCMIALVTATMQNSTIAMLPLHRASADGNLDLCNTLLAAKADANAPDNVGNTPLLCAAGTNHLGIVQTLLKVNGINVNAQNNEGKTALHLAAHYHHFIVVMALLMHPGINSHLKDLRGDTPLQSAQQENKIEVSVANKLATIQAIEAHQQLTRGILKAKL